MCKPHRGKKQETNTNMLKNKLYINTIVKHPGLKYSTKFKIIDA